jgi:hypothetical protein
VKTLLGAVVFLVSLVLMRRILVNAGLLEPWTAFLFVTSAVGVSLAGFLFVEGAIDAHRNETRRELEALRRELHSRESAPRDSGREPS